MRATQQEFEALMIALIEGAANEAQQEQIRQCLREHTPWRAEYRWQMQMHAMLVWQHGGANRALKEPVTSSQTPSIFFRSSWAQPLLAAAAVLVLLMSITLWFTLRSLHPTVALEVLGGDSVPAFVAGQQIALRQIALTSGTLRFRLESGAEIEVTGPAEVELLDSMRLRVMHGNVTTDVGERAKGFVVETANAHVVDLGTRFGVSVGGSGDTDVVVFEGKVEVYDPQKTGQQSSQLVSLIEGEAMQISAKGARKRVACVFTERDFGRWSQQPPRGAVITDVRDNSADQFMHLCYRVGVGAMTTGASLRQVHPLWWRPLTGAQLPDWLEGADWVETGSRYDEQLSLDLSVTLSRPAALYVLQDSRQPVPGWLRERFAETDTRLLLEWPAIRPSRDALATRQFTVWRMEVLQPGIVTLGPQLEPGQTSNGRMYRIAAKALP